MIVFAWSRGGSGELVETDGELVTVRSNAPFPPGTPLDGAFEGSTYRIKVRSCRRSDDAPEWPFRIEGQFQSLTREQRERVLR